MRASREEKYAMCEEFNDYIYIIYKFANSQILQKQFLEIISFFVKDSNSSIRRNLLKMQEYELIDIRKSVFQNNKQIVLKKFALQYIKNNKNVYKKSAESEAQSISSLYKSEFIIHFLKNKSESEFTKMLENTSILFSKNKGLKFCRTLAKNRLIKIEKEQHFEKNRNWNYNKALFLKYNQHVRDKNLKNIKRLTSNLSLKEQEVKIVVETAKILKEKNSKENTKDLFTFDTFLNSNFEFLNSDEKSNNFIYLDVSEVDFKKILFKFECVINLFNVYFTDKNKDYNLTICVKSLRRKKSIESRLESRVYSVRNRRYIDETYIERFVNKMRFEYSIRSEIRIDFIVLELEKKYLIS